VIRIRYTHVQQAGKTPEEIEEARQRLNAMIVDVINIHLAPLQHKINQALTYIGEELTVLTCIEDDAGEVSCPKCDGNGPEGAD